MTEFGKAFATEKQCLDYLFNLRWTDGYCCPRCKYKECWSVEEHKYKCKGKNCGYQTTITAGTKLHGSRISMMLWFRAVWEVTSKQNRITVLELQKKLELGSNRTALKLLNTLIKASHQSRGNPSLKLNGNISYVAEESLRLPKGWKKIAIIFELEKYTIGYIRICPLENASELSDYIISDDIVNKIPLAPGLLNIYVAKIISKLKSRMNDFPDSYSHEHFAEYLDTFCDEYNKSIYEKKINPNITFDELLQNLIKDN